MAVSLVSQMRCNLHSIMVKLKSRVTITIASRKALDFMGTVNLMILLAPMLEIDLKEVVVSSNNLE